MVAALLVYLLCSLSYSTVLTEAELLEAIKVSPEIYRLHGEQAAHIKGYETRLTRPRRDHEEALSGPIICHVTGALSGYTRFKTPELAENFEIFRTVYTASKYRRKKNKAEAMFRPEGSKSKASELIAEILDMCTIVLHESDGSREAKMLIGKKRSMLRLITSEDNICLGLITQSQVLFNKALSLINEHLFSFFAPLDIDFSVVEPSEIADIAYPTMKYIYTLLIKLVSVADQLSPAFTTIREYPDLAQRLYQLLYLPDARERKHVEVAVINLFTSHQSLRKNMVRLLRYKYNEMKAHFAEDYAFIYHDILAIHRGFYITAKNDPECEGLAKTLAGLFQVYAIPLIALPDLADFSDQWTFTMLEIGSTVEDSLTIFIQHAFAPGGHRTLYYRDLETLCVLENLLAETEVTTEVLQSISRFLIEKASAMLIRPALQDKMLDKMYGPDSVIYRSLNGFDGTLLNDFMNFPQALMDVLTGLRKFFVAVHEMDMEMPENILEIIDLWKGSFDLMNVFTDGSGLLEDEGRAMREADDLYQTALLDYNVIG